MLIPRAVQALGEHICPAHTGQTVALPPLPWAGQKLLDHTGQAQAKLLFWQVFLQVSCPKIPGSTYLWQSHVLMVSQRSRTVITEP